MRLYNENEDFQTIRMNKEEFEEQGIKRGDLIKNGKAFYKVWSYMEDGHGNVLILVEHPVTVHAYV